MDGTLLRIEARKYGDNWLVLFPNGASRVLTDRQYDRLFEALCAFNPARTKMIALDHRRYAIDTPYIPARLHVA